MKRRSSTDSMPFGAVMGADRNRSINRTRTKNEGTAVMTDSTISLPSVLTVDSTKEKNSDFTENMGTNLLSLDHSIANPSISYLICLNALICGIEFSASAGFAYIPPLLQKIGLSKSITTCLMGIGPFLSLGAIPLLGSWSDRCEFRFGRRWPYILGVSLLLLLSLLFIPFGNSVGAFIGSSRAGIIFTALGVVLLDFSCLIGFNPCEALVSDAVQGTDSVRQGFMVYSCMLSIGGCIGYFITATDWSGTVLGSVFTNQEQMAFSVIILLMVIAGSTTLLAAKTNALVKHSTECEQNSIPTSFSKILQLKNNEINDDIGYETGSNDSQSDELVCQNQDKNIVPCTFLVINRTVCNSHSTVLNKEKAFHPAKILKNLRNPFATLTYFPQKIQTFFRRKNSSSKYSWWWLPVTVPCYIIKTPVQSLQKVFSVPTVLRRLFLADFCGWAALLCYYMFYTDYIAQAVFVGNPNAPEGTLARLHYDAGVRMGSLGLFLHSITACLYTGFFQNYIINHYGLAHAYLLGLSCFAFCMAGILLTYNIIVINVLTSIAGIGFAAITTIPNTLITGYHEDKEIYFFDAKKIDDLNPDESLDRGIAADIAVIDSAYVLAQIMLSLVMGPLVDITHTVMVYIIISTLFAFLACYCITRVIFTVTSAKCLRDTRI